MQILGKFCADVRVQNVAWPRDRRSDFRKLDIKRCTRLERKKSWKGVSRSAAVAKQSQISCRGGGQIDPPPVKIGLNVHINWLKPMYSFGKWWKWKNSLMGIVYRVVWVLKALWISLSETINFLRKLHKTNISGMPPKFYHRVMYIAPSSGHISFNFNLHFKLILRWWEVVFWCLEWGYCTFWKIDGNSSQSTNTILS